MELGKVWVPCCKGLVFIISRLTIQSPKALAFLYARMWGRTDHIEKSVYLSSY